MKSIVTCCLLVTIFGISQGFPRKYGLYYPKRSVMFGSYYSNPMAGYDYVPQGQMTAMVSGDTVATNAFSGQPWRAPPPVVQVPDYPAVEIPEHQPSAEHITERNDQHVQPQYPYYTENEADSEFGSEVETNDSKSQEVEPASSSEVAEVVTEVQDFVVTSTKAPKVIPSKKIGSKRKAKKPVKQEEEQNDDDDEDMASGWPFGGPSSRRGSGLPSGYNTFFPIFIGGSNPSGRSRTRQSGAIEEDDMPVMPSGSATAIANAFSTGKGGVATSHATSFGDPMAAAFLRNSGYFGDYEGFVRRNKNNKNASED